MVFFVLAVRRGLGSILLWGAREYWRIFCRFTMLKLFSPHHCVGFLFPTSLCGDLVFRMHPAGASAASAAASPSAASCSLTHSLTHSLIHSLTHSLTQYRELPGCLSRGRRSTQSLLEELRRAWSPLGPRLPFACQAQYTEIHRASWRSCGMCGRRWGRGCLSWQAQYTEPPGGAAARVVAAGAAAAFRVVAAGAVAASLVAGAVHSRASWRNYDARGRRWGRGCLSRLPLSCGRRSTQSLLEELQRAWSPLGPQLPFAWQAQYTKPPGGAAARVVAAGAAAAFRVAGAVHRASWRSGGARGRRWGRGCLSRGRRSTQSLLAERRHAWSPLGPRLPFVAGAVHRASWRSCGARGRRWGRGCLSRGRRSTQSVLEELRRA